MRKLEVAGEETSTPVAGVFKAVTPPEGYSGLAMVGEDGVLLVEMIIHNRAGEHSERVEDLREWYARIVEKESQPSVQLVALTRGDDPAS